MKVLTHTQPNMYGAFYMRTHLYQYKLCIQIQLSPVGDIGEIICFHLLYISVYKTAILQTEVCDLPGRAVTGTKLVA